MAQLSWIQSKITEWWQEAFSKAWLESDFKRKSVPRPSCSLPWHLHSHHENENPVSPLWLHVTWKHFWGAQRFPKLRGASCPSQHSAILPWPSGTDLLISSQAFPNDDFIVEGNGDTTKWHIFSRKPGQQSFPVKDCSAPHLLLSEGWDMPGFPCRAIAG